MVSATLLAAFSIVTANCKWRNMDSLFLGCLVLFFLQGVFGRDNRIARGLCMLFVFALSWAMLHSLR